MAGFGYGQDCGKTAAETASRTVSELRDLRTWRALMVEAWGQVRPLETFAFALGTPVADVLPQLGLGGSVWAEERWAQLRRALDEPVPVPACFADGEKPAELPQAA